MAVIRTSFATKDDVQSLREEIHAATERIMKVLYEHKLEFNLALTELRTDFNAALARQHEEFNAALARQHEEFNLALMANCVELHKTLMNHTWRVYGLAIVLLGAVYYIARTVH